MKTIKFNYNEDSGNKNNKINGSINHVAINYGNALANTSNYIIFIRNYCY